MKEILFTLMMIAAISCSGNLGPGNNGPMGGNDPGQIPGGNQEQNQAQNVNPPAETFPCSSGIVMDDEASSKDNIANAGEFNGTISITFSQNDATVSGSVEGVTVQNNGARVTVTNSGEKAVKYILSGTSTDGYFKLAKSSKKQAIVLSNLSLVNTKGAAINNQSKKKTFLVLEGTNTISDGNVNNSGDYPEESSDEDMKAAIFSEGQLALSGSGTLTVNAIGKAGITSDDYVHFMTGSDVTVNSSKGHGVRGKDAIIVSGGTVKVTLASSATAKKCFSSDSLVFIGGGKTTLVNKASAGTVDSELTGAAGIKADKVFVIQGGELSITASGKGCKCISGDENGYFEGGTVVVSSSGDNYGSSGQFADSENSVSSKAIKFDGNLEFSKSQVTASSAFHEAIESKGTIYISGGQIKAVSSDDAINSGSTMTVSDGVVYAYSSGNDGLDANGNMIIKGGTVYAIGCGTPEVALDANTESGYRLFIMGGNVIAIGGIESNSYYSQAVISTTWSKNTTYTLCDGNNVLFSVKTPGAGGAGLYMSSPSLINGTEYSLKTSATVSGATSYFDGILQIGGTASGGSTASVTASTYTSQEGGMGGGPGGPTGPGGFGW